MERKMKLSADYVIQPLVDEYLVIPIGEAGKRFRGVIRMNATGAFMWNAIRNGADTKEKILAEVRKAYEDADMEKAEEDLNRFLDTIQMALEE